MNHDATPLQLWILFAAMGLVTLVARASFLLLQDRWTMPAVVRRALPYVPPAVLAALVAPALLEPSGRELLVADVRWIAGAVAVAVAWRTRSILATLGVGMGVLWLATALAGAVA